MPGEKKHNSDCPSEYGLDAFWLAGQPDDHPLAGHIARCPACQGRLKERAAISEEFHADVYPASVGKVADRTVDWLGGRRGAFGRLLTVPRLAAVGALALVLVVVGIVFWRPDVAPVEEPAYTAIKGSVGMKIFCKRAGRVFNVRPGDVLLPGDRIRFEVATPGPGFVVLVAVEADGDVQSYGSTRVVSEVSGTEVALPGSIVLDKSPAAERIFAVFSEDKLDIEVVRSAARRAFERHGSIGNMLELPVGSAQASLWFNKGTSER